MSLIPDELKERVRTQLAENLARPVRILMFTQEPECRFCSDTKQLIIELAGMNDKINAEVHDFVADNQLAKEYGVDKLPAVIIMGDKDYGIRFYGLPYGYEFQTLMTVIIMVSRGETGLSQEIKSKLMEIKNPVNIKVFVSLTCPHCPYAATTAYRFAMENSAIKAEIIDTSEFPYLAQRYAVMGVPKVVINEKIEFVGALPEDLFLEHLLLAAQ